MARTTTTGPQAVNQVIQRLLEITLLVFMAGNMLETGLKVNLRGIGGALRDGRFVLLTLLWSFALGPAVACGLTRLLPLAAPYALGLLFLGMAPGAPFLPGVARRASGDLEYVAAFLVLTAVGTVLFMPLAVPVLVKGFAADAWTIAKPLACFVVVPLLTGIAFRVLSPRLAEVSHPVVRRITAADTAVMLVCLVILYGRDFLGVIGTYTILAQVLFCAIVTVGAYASGQGLAASRNSVLALGVCTRNIGAAIAPLCSVPGTDQRAIVMCALAVPVTLVCSLVAARCFARRQPVTRESAPLEPS